MAKALPKPIDGTLRKFSLRVPEVIRECSGIVVFGKRIKSLVFSTDVAIIRNVNADAIIAVYPFTPQPIITQAILSASDIPVFVGVGGGLTSGKEFSAFPPLLKCRERRELFSMLRYQTKLYGMSATILIFRQS